MLTRVIILFQYFKLLVKEVQDALQAATTKAKMRQYEEFDGRLTECELARSQKFYFNQMRKAAEKIPVTSLLPVGHAYFFPTTHIIYIL